MLPLFSKSETSKFGIQCGAVSLCLPGHGYGTNHQQPTPQPQTPDLGAPPAPGKCTHAGESVECYHRTMPAANVRITPCSMRIIAAAAAASRIASTRTLDARHYSFLHFFFEL